MKKLEPGLGKLFRSACPIASSLDLIGDRWTMLIIRDLVMGASRYSDFLSSPEGIPTNILASRLKAMEVAGLITKSLYQTAPPRFAYSLTESGKALITVMRAIKDWGMAWLPARNPVPPANLAWVVRPQSDSGESG